MLFISAGAVTLSWSRICPTASPVGGNILQRPGPTFVCSAMDEGTGSDTVPDLKDLEVKIGRKTPEGLLRWMREEASSYRGDAKMSAPQDGSRETGMVSLDEKIRKLKAEMAHLRSVDVKILQQLLAVHEGIEAVKWLMEERSTLTSRCSSLTSSQYSLGDTSWRGSWSSLQDPNDRLDNISIGSYLDTLADDMDEYCPSSSESAITAGGRVGGVPGAGAGLRSGSQAGISENGGEVKSGTEVKGGPETGTTCSIPMNGTGSGLSEIPLSSPQKKPEAPKPDNSACTKAAETGKGSPVSKGNAQTQALKSNGVLEKASKQTSSPICPGLKAKRGTSQSPKLQPYKNGKIDMDTCKMNGKMHLEYDAHWRWVQSQEDVTFL